VHVLVIQAHPRADSLSGQLALAAERGLRRAGHDVTVLRLYGDGFRAAMSDAERAAYHGDQPILDPVVAEHAAAMRTADALVFVYPTWWMGLPAIMKGWLERVLVPGVAFRFDERTHKVMPTLGHVRHIVGITTYGSPRWHSRLVGDGGRRTLLRALRMVCGWRTRTSWFGLWSVDQVTDDVRAAFVQRVEHAMAGFGR
jgi:putative NADPH-quinone reductase